MIIFLAAMPVHGLCHSIASAGSKADVGPASRLLSGSSTTKLSSAELNRPRAAGLELDLGVNAAILACTAARHRRLGTRILRSDSRFAPESG